MLRRSGGTFVLHRQQRQDFTSALSLKVDTRSLLVEGAGGKTDLHHTITLLTRKFVYNFDNSEIGGHREHKLSCRIGCGMWVVVFIPDDAFSNLPLMISLPPCESCTGMCWNSNNFIIFAE